MYKSGLYLLLLFLFPLLSSANNELESFFSKGNDYYAKAKYEEALKAYQQIINQGYESAEVYFNLGNTNYKLGDFPSAILNYEKAAKLSPGDEAVSINLQLANLKITDKIEAVPELFLSTWWKNFMLIFSAQEWSAIGVVLLILGFLLLIVYLFAIVLPVKKYAFYIGICLAVAGVFSVVISGLQQNYFKNNLNAIVFAGTLNVKSGPDDREKTVFVIHEGTKVEIKTRDKDWIEVELPNGNTGWINASAVKEI